MVAQPYVGLVDLGLPPGPQSLPIQRNTTLEGHHHWFEVGSRSMVQMDDHMDPWTNHFHVGSPNMTKLCTNMDFTKGATL